MKINKIRSGQIFAIEGAKSYPKLKLDIGYIDMRDKILNRHDGILRALEVQLMTDSEVNREFKKYNMSTKDWKDLRKRLLEKYNSEK
jgi:hypothetical protein